MNLPNEEIVIRADGRRLWRVLSNIYNNAAKYAMQIRVQQMLLIS